jgi:hypothetical protein
MRNAVSANTAGQASHPSHEVEEVILTRRKFSGMLMIRKLKSGQFRLYSGKKNPKTGKRRNLGTFKSLKAAQNHERAVQFFKRH